MVFPHNCYTIFPKTNPNLQCLTHKTIRWEKAYPIAGLQTCITATWTQLFFKLRKNLTMNLFKSLASLIWSNCLSVRMKKVHKWKNSIICKMEPNTLGKLLMEWKMARGRCFIMMGDSMMDNGKKIFFVGLEGFFIHPIS